MTRECINRVELQGIIGSARRYTVGGQEGFQFTLATNRAYKDKDGNPVIETQWTVCTGWEKDGIDESIFKKGQTVHLTGRLRTQRYTTADGDERYTTEVIVHDIRKAD